MPLRLDTRVHGIDAEHHRFHVTTPTGDDVLDYDALVVGTGATPITPPIRGPDHLGPRDGIHLLHTMGDTFALMDTLGRDQVKRAVIVGGYIGLEMAEALTARDLSVTQVEQLLEVLPTVDPDPGALIHRELERHGVTVACGTRVDAIEVAPPGSDGRLDVLPTGPGGGPLRLPADGLLIVVGVTGHHRPQAGAHRRRERSQRIAPIRRQPRHQVVKAFDLVAARTGLRDRRRSPPGSSHCGRVASRSQGCSVSSSSVTSAPRSPNAVDIAATAIFAQLAVDAISDLDVSYTPPLGSPWDALQTGAQTWIRSGQAPSDGRPPAGGPQPSAGV